MDHLTDRTEKLASNYVPTIQRAITNSNLLHIQYKTGYSNEFTERTIEPQALYFTENYWVMIAWCHLRNDYREFRLDRLMNLNLQKEIFESRDFDLMKYFYSILSP